MLFITNRSIKQRQTKRLRAGRKITLDINNNDAGQSVYFSERKSKDSYIELGAQNFLYKLKESASKQILIYIHGFSNLPEPHIFPRALTLQKMFDQKQNGLVEVIPLIWPCDNDFGAVKDYWDDQKSADASAFAFARVLEKFIAWRGRKDNVDIPCLKRINILAHSMGNRVLRETLRVWAKYDRDYQLPLLFRNSFLVAADIVNESLETGHDGSLACQCSRNVSVYFASDDIALRASKISNLKNKIASRRLGHTGPENMKKVPINVYAIDCDDINTKYDFPKGHSYFLHDKTEKKPGVVFDHIFNSIKTGRVKVDDSYHRVSILK